MVGLIAIASALLFWGAENAEAWVPATVQGKIFMMKGSETIHLPDVKVWRKDFWNWSYCSGDSKCYGEEDGVESTTDSNGAYSIGNSGNNPGPVAGCLTDRGATSCPTGPMGGVSDRGGSCNALNWCGYNCGSNPHMWTPYFTSNYSDWMATHHPGISFKAGDRNGGGTFVPVSSSGGCEEAAIDGQWWRLSVDNKKNYEGCDFEWIPPDCHVACSLSASPQTAVHHGGGTITLTADVAGDYDTVSWNWKPNTQPCGDLRTDPGNQLKAYVDFATGDICAGEIVAVASNACSAQCETTFEIINNGPQVERVSPNSGLSGTLDDSDNGPTCSDNNPQIYAVTYSDPNGCDDIESAYVWIGEQVPQTEFQHSSAHAGVKRSGTGWKKYGLSCTNRCEDDSNYHWSVGGDALTDDEPTSPYTFSPKNSLIHTDCRSRAGSCTNAVAGVHPFAASCSGNELTVKYKVWYYDDTIGHNLNVYGFVIDYSGDTDGWDDVGDWELDFVHPVATVQPLYQPGDPTNTIRFNEDVQDRQPYDSGVRSIINRRYWIDRSDGSRLPPASGTFYSIAADVWGVGGVPQWTQNTGPVPSGTSDSRPYLQGGDIVNAEITAVDMACNRAGVSSSSGSVGHQWIQTFKNDVYGFGGMNDPIQVSGEALSQYWLGGNTTNSCAPAVFGVGIGSLAGWCTSSYDDFNRREVYGDRYGDLYRLASNSSWVRNSASGALVQAGAVNFDGSGDGAYVFTGSTLTMSGYCRDRKVVFVPSGANVTVQPPFEKRETGDGCLIVAAPATTITVSAGSEAPDDIDRVDAAFISDGNFVVESDNTPPTYDRVLINGFVFANDARFKRGLLFEDSLLNPAVTIEYDAGFLHLFRDFLGRKKFDGFECGIVEDSPLCVDWYE